MIGFFLEMKGLFRETIFENQKQFSKLENMFAKLWLEKKKQFLRFYSENMLLFWEKFKVFLVVSYIMFWVTIESTKNTF